jgi:hypothetical protein
MRTLVCGHEGVPGERFVFVPLFYPGHPRSNSFGELIRTTTPRNPAPRRVLSPCFRYLLLAVGSHEIQRLREIFVRGAAGPCISGQLAN